MNSSKVVFSQVFLRLLKFILPFCLWMFLFRDFLTGRIPLNMDTATIYSVTKFYFNNLLNGVVPLWDPYVFLGTPFYAITLCNLFNPVTLLVPVLKVLGADYYHAFLVYMVVFYFLGTLGFYCLAKIVVKDSWMAYVGFLMLLFSGIGASMFNQWTIIELFTPAVWFFVFLLRFATRYRAADFMGLVLSAMMLAIAYLPFYFATLALCAVVIGGVIFPGRVLSFFRGTWDFIRQHKILALLAVAGLIAALMPLLVYKLIDSGHDVVSPGRHCNYSEITECYERTLNEHGGMSYKETSQAGGLAERVHWRGLFTHLDKVSYGIDQFFYVPVFFYLVILLSCFVAVDRTRLFLALLAAILALIAMADVTPLHRFLYERVFFFKYFRNLFFFQTYIIPLMVLFAVGQLKALCGHDISTFSRKKALVFWAVVVTGAMVAFCLTQDGITVTTTTTVLAGGLIFVIAYLGCGDMRRTIFWGAVCLTVLQPVEIYTQYSRNAREFQCELPGDHVHPRFSWTRPTEEVKSNCKIFKFVHYESFYDSLNMKDARGFIGYPVSVTRGAFLLSQWVLEPVLLEYTSHKFWLYDAVRGFDAQAQEIRSLGDVFHGRLNAAYVNPSADEPIATFTEEDWGSHPPAENIGPTVASVEIFNPNRLKVRLDLPQKKFLVYTDAFTQHWRVFVNDRPQKLFRAQAAFKGVWVPDGKSTVDFRYEPPGGGWIYLTVTGVFVAAFLGTLAFFRRENDWPWQEN